MPRHFTKTSSQSILGGLRCFDFPGVKGLSLRLVARYQLRYQCKMPRPKLEEKSDLRTPPFALASEALDDLEHLTTATACIDISTTHTHADLLRGMRLE